MKFNSISGNGTALLDLFKLGSVETLLPGAGNNNARFQNLLFNILQNSKLLNPEQISQFTKIADENSELSKMLSGLTFINRDVSSIEPAQFAGTELKILSADSKTPAWNEIVADVKDELSLKMARFSEELLNRATGEMDKIQASRDGSSGSGQEPEVINILWVGMPLPPELVSKMQALLQTGLTDIAGVSVPQNIDSNDQTEETFLSHPDQAAKFRNPEMKQQLQGIAWMAANVLQNFKTENPQMKTEIPTGSVSQNQGNRLSGNEIYLQLFASDEPAAAAGMTEEISAALEPSKLVSDPETGILPQSGKTFSSLIPEISGTHPAGLSLAKNSPVQNEKFFTVSGKQIRISGRDLPLTPDGVVAFPMSESGSAASVPVLLNQDVNQFAFLVTDAANHFLRELPETAAAQENSNLLFYSRSAKGFVQIVNDPLANLPAGIANSTGAGAKTVNLFAVNGVLNEIDFAPQQNNTDQADVMVKNLVEQISVLPVPAEEGIESTFKIMIPQEAGSVTVRLKKVDGQILATVQPDQEKTTALLKVRLFELNEALRTTKIHIGEMAALPQAEGTDLPGVQPGNQNGISENSRLSGGAMENPVTMVSPSQGDEIGDTADRFFQPEIIRMIRIANTVPDGQKPERQHIAGASIRSGAKNFPDGKNTIFEQSGNRQFLKTSDEAQPSIKQQTAGNGGLPQPELSNSEKSIVNFSFKPDNNQQMVVEIAGQIISQYQNEEIEASNSPVAITPENSEQVHFSTEKNNGQLVGLLRVDDPKIAEQIRKIIPGLTKALQEQNIPVAKLQVQVKENRLSPEQVNHQAGKEVVKQITSRIAGAIQTYYSIKEKETVKQLQPENQGRVKTIPAKESGGFAVSLQVEQPELKKIVEAESGSLKKSLKQKNIPVENIEVKNTPAQFTAEDKIHLTEQELKQPFFRGESFIDHNLLRKLGSVEMPGQQGHLLPKEIPLKQMMDQIVRSTRLQYLPGKTQIKIYLKPEYLGAVTIIIKDNGKQVHGALYAERPEIRQALESQLPILYKSLQEQNIRLDKLDILDYSSQFAQQNHSQNTGEETNHPMYVSDFFADHGGDLTNSGEYNKTDQIKNIRYFGYNTLELIA